MCTMSMIMDSALTLPQVTWQQPEFGPNLEELLRKAKEYDRITGQPDCELDEKRLALKKIADEMGVPVQFP